MHRLVHLFRNGRNQAIRIPREYELPGDQAIIHREGDRLIIEPAQPQSLTGLLRSWEPLADEFPDVDDLPSPDEIDL